MRLPRGTQPGTHIEAHCPNCQKRAVGLFDDIVNLEVQDDVEEGQLREAIERSIREQVANSLPRESYDEHQHKDLGEECPLCLDEYVNGAELTRLPCMHA